MICDRCKTEVIDLSEPCPTCGLQATKPGEPQPAADEAPETLGRSPLASWVELIDNANIGWGRRGYEKLIGSMVGEYEVTGWIGEGGMGAVLSGIQPLIGKKVAIKILKTQFISNPESMKRFVAEARAVNEIGHPNIVDIFSFGQFEDGTLFFVMEYLEGETFADYLTHHQITYENARLFLSDVLDALEAAHAKGIVHRDLKPDNIFIIQKNPSKQFVKLLDFGVAKFTEEGLHSVSTTTGLPLGTPVYMSPEQCNGNRVDPRSDIYSLGVLMYQMFAGRLPFDGTFMQVLTAHFIEEPVPPSRFAAIPPALEQVILWCLRKEPADRPANVAELKSVLLPLLEELGQAQKAPTLLPEARRYRTTDKSLAEIRQILTPQPTGHRSLPWVLSGIILVLLVSLTVLLVNFRQRDTAYWGSFLGYRTPDAAHPEQPRPATAEAPEQNRTTGVVEEQVLLQLQIEPAVKGRKILVDGREQLEPFFRVGRSEDRTISIRVEAAGYHPWEHRMLPAFSQNIPVLLKEKSTSSVNPMPPAPMPLDLPDVL